MLAPDSEDRLPTVEKLNGGIAVPPFNLYWLEPWRKPGWHVSDMGEVMKYDVMYAGALPFTTR